jgi:hypothetical protein
MQGVFIVSDKKELIRIQCAKLHESRLLILQNLPLANTGFPRSYVMGWLVKIGIHQVVSQAAQKLITPKSFILIKAGFSFVDYCSRMLRTSNAQKSKQLISHNQP